MEPPAAQNPIPPLAIAPLAIQPLAIAPPPPLAPCQRCRTWGWVLEQAGTYAAWRCAWCSALDMDHHDQAELGPPRP
jgi:hypothetical protein